MPNYQERENNNRRFTKICTSVAQVEKLASGYRQYNVPYEILPYGDGFAGYALEPFEFEKTQDKDLAILASSEAHEKGPSPFKRELTSADVIL